MPGGTIVLGGQLSGRTVVWGDSCPGGTLVWGDSCPGGQLSRGTNVGGTNVGGTLVRGTNVTTPFGHLTRNVRAECGSLDHLSLTLPNII